MRNLLSIRDLETDELARILGETRRFKEFRGKPGHPTPLAGRSYAMVFSKSSTRTRVSFEVGIRELCGHPLFLSASELQLGRGESEEDTARVLSRYVHGIVVRTHAHAGLESFAANAAVPVINGLSDSFHPCQVIADLYTLEERLGTLDGLRIAWVGDGGSNVAHSWILASALLPIDLRIASPAGYGPSPAVLALAESARLKLCADPREADRDVHAVYTDVWVSMGFEAEREARLEALRPYRLDAALLAAAGPQALVMHCLPAHPGEEITREVLESGRSIVWDQAENRLHAQKAIMQHFFAQRRSPAATEQGEGLR